MEMQAGTRQFLLRLAESQFDGLFVRLHGVDRLEEPESHDSEGDKAEQRRAGCASAGQRLPQPVLAAADDVFEIGR
jgi:hypothetical protein